MVFNMLAINFWCTLYKYTRLKVFVYNKIKLLNFK